MNIQFQHDWLHSDTKLLKGKSGDLTFWSLLLLGLLVRVFFCFRKDLSFDSIDFLFYIQSPDPNSSSWSNYPPFFLILVKAVSAPFGGSVLAIQSLLFALNAGTFLVLAFFFRRVSLFALLLSTVNPASLYASTQLAPIALVEFLSVLLFVLIQKKDLRRKDWGAALILVVLIFASTYTAVIYAAFLAYSRGSRIKSIKSRVLLLMSLTGAGIWAYFQVGWKTVAWLNTTSVVASLVASAQLFYAFAGYSWIALGLLIVGLVYRWRCGMGRELALFSSMLFIVVTLNVLLSKTASEPRFFIYWTPWILLFFARSIEKMEPRLRIGMGLVVAFFVLKGGLWFLIYPRSGALEARALLQQDRPSVVKTIGLSPRVDRDFRELGTLGSQPCRRAYIWRLKDRSNQEIEEKVQNEGGVLLKDITTKQPSVDPLRYQLWEGNCF